MSEKKDAPVRVLFSCFGKTDPARGERDGGLLHILRHYRPDAVMIFLTSEMIKWDRADNRIEKTWELMRAKWDGYQPTLIRYETDIKNPSDLDLVNGSMITALREFQSAYPNAEVLLNLSSGTPQMKMTLALWAIERKGMLGIQVLSPEDAANTAEPSTKTNYPIDEELELAEEAETDPKIPKRCSEPTLLALRRDRQRKQVEAFLQSRDYQAVVEVLSCQSIVPEEALHMAKHLAARYSLQGEAARKALHGLNVDFPLYPKKTGATDEQKKEYAEVSEYFLMMKNFAETGRYSDFVLRLNPFTIRLQEALLDVLLRRQYGVELKEVKGYVGKVRREQLLEVKLRAKVPGLLEQLNGYLSQHGRDPFRDSDPSIYIYNLLLSFLPEESLEEKEKFYRSLLVRIGTLNREGRNLVAHNLTAALTDADIRESVGCSCAELVQALENAIITLYPACDPSLFNIYRKCEEYIRERL